MKMSTALTALRKLLGPKAAIRDNRRPSSPEQRDAADAARRATALKRAAALAAVEARKEAVLSADAEYQRLRQEFHAARAAHESLPHAEYRYVCGVASALFFTVKAEADNLEELIEKVRAQKG
jgi:hypothetical protein